jgi:hypothetical protein
MMTSRQTVPTLLEPDVLTLADSALSHGALLLGAAGTGKTTSQALLALQLLRRGFPQVILDPTGTLSTAFIFLLLRFLRGIPAADRSAYWKKLRYIDLGNPTVVTSFPIYQKTGSETLREVAERFIETLRLLHPGLDNQASVTFPRLRRVGVNAGMVLAALGFQLTEAEDLLVNTLAWEKSGKFQEAINQNPQSAPAVSYFREQYLPLSRSAKTQLISPFLDHVFTLSYDPKLQALFSANTPGLNCEESLEERGETVILDCKNITDPVARTFTLLWILQYLLAHIKTRGRRTTHLGLLIDEFADLTTQVTDGINPLVPLLDMLIQRYCRNNQIFLCLAFQSINQIDPQLQNTVFSLGTLVVGRTTIPEARILADQLFRKDPWRVKRLHNVWGRDVDYRTRLSSHYVIEQEPVYMSLPDQQEEAAFRIADLSRFRFLCRPALREGDISHTVFSLNIDRVVQDAETGEYSNPDEELVERVRSRLATRSGIPVKTIHQLIASRLANGTGKLAPQGQGLPVAADEPTAPRSMPEQGQPVLQRRKTHPTHRTLAEDHVKLLTYLIAQPDAPVTEVNQKSGIRAAKLAVIREELTAQGYLQELAVSSGSATGGRPLKFLIPTLKAWEQLGSDPPKGRGGAIHRHVQRMVVNGALAKGYSAMVEHAVGTGIVDVHLQKGAGVQIAVEIAIASKPAREVAHFQHCLAAGYDQIYGLILDDQLREQTATLIRETFAPQDAGKIRLLPLQLLSQVG